MNNLLLPRPFSIADNNTDDIKIYGRFRIIFFIKQTQQNSQRRPSSNRVSSFKTSYQSSSVTHLLSLKNFTSFDVNYEEKNAAINDHFLFSEIYHHTVYLFLGSVFSPTPVVLTFVRRRNVFRKVNSSSSFFVFPNQQRVGSYSVNGRFGGQEERMYKEEMRIKPSIFI